MQAKTGIYPISNSTILTKILHLHPSMDGMYSTPWSPNNCVNTSVGSQRKLSVDFLQLWHIVIQQGNGADWVSVCSFGGVDYISTLQCLKWRRDKCAFCSQVITSGIKPKFSFLLINHSQIIIQSQYAVLPSWPILQNTKCWKTMLWHLWLISE